MKEFYKYSGSGNDFIIMDFRDGAKAPSPKAIMSMCARRTGIGADGLILLKRAEKCDFRMVYYNSDGYEADMCGNGGRCIALFAYKTGICRKKEMVFCSRKGVHKAYIMDGGVVKLQLSRPHSYRKGIEVKSGKEVFRGDFLNTGVPHFVIPVADVEGIDVDFHGRNIRRNMIFAPEGTNVNFIMKKGGKVLIRTYERGVEAETLACGTGATASAIVSSCIFKMKSPVRMSTRSGEMLLVYFDSKHEEVFLEGKVTPVYRGDII